MEENAQINDFLYFLAGLLGGYLTSSYFHNKQKSESKVFENKMISTLAKIYHVAAQNRDSNREIVQKITSIERDLEPVSDVVIIRSEMDEILSQLKARNIKRAEDLPTDLVLKYKALGEKWSELVSTQLELKILDTSGRVSVERLLSVHKSIFPENFPWAGKIRDQHVFVIDRFGTTARIVDVSAAETKIETIAPAEILANLEKLLSFWDSNVAKFSTMPARVKVEEVAHFHHEFEIIHPFFDGNGRIGRLILEEQLSFLFHQHVTFRPNRDQYYRALRMLNMGEVDSLIDLIQEELRKFSISI